jgi:hypothetical protein
MDITARVFELTDLPIDLVYQSVDGIGMNVYLSEIVGCLHEGLSPMKPDGPIAESRKQHIRALSSNQFFLNVCRSSRRDTSLQAISEVSLFLTWFARRYLNSWRLDSDKYSVGD